MRVLDEQLLANVGIPTVGASRTRIHTGTLHHTFRSVYVRRSEKHASYLNLKDVVLRTSWSLEAPAVASSTPCEGTDGLNR